MPIISPSFLKKLLSQNEDSTLDYKLLLNLDTRGGKKEFAKDVSAMANFLYLNDGTGYIIVGIRDSTRALVGLTPNSFKEERLQQILKTRIEPPPIISADIISYLSVDLGVVKITRSPLGPHKWMNEGYPIRRGSTTDIMSPLEVVESITTRERRVTRLGSDYSVFGSVKRYRQINNDIYMGLLELGLNKKYTGFTPFKLGYTTVNILNTTKTINGRRYRIFFRVYSDNLDSYRLRFSNRELSQFYDFIPTHRSIIIDVVHGTVYTRNLTQSLQAWRGNRTLIKITPSIFYYGSGLGILTRKPLLDYRNLPRFFFQRIKSQIDIKTRIELVFHWIEENNTLFQEIRDAFAKERERDIRRTLRKTRRRIT